MNSNQAPTYDPADDEALDLAALSGAIATQLSVIAPQAQRNQRMATQLLGRARLSALAHAQFVTVRREDLGFKPTGNAVGGVCHTIRQDAAVRIQVMQLEPGALLQWPAGVLAQEILVLDGTLVEDALLAVEPRSAKATVTPYELRLLQPESAALTVGAAGARLYVRQLLNLMALPTAEQTWWTQGADPVSTEWAPRSPDLDMKSLRCVGTVVSKLMRLKPGGRLRDHGHDLDEDCMMLEGDLQMGDILLRADDYQLAPKGAAHVNAMSERGALFYIHGNLPNIP